MNCTRQCALRHSLSQLPVVSAAELVIADSKLVLLSVSSNFFNFRFRINNEQDRPDHNKKLELLASKKKQNVKRKLFLSFFQVKK